MTETKSERLSARFYHDLVSDGISDSFVGISMSSKTGDSVIDLYSPEMNRLALGSHKPFNACVLSSRRLVFHDPNRHEFGAVDFESFTWWSKYDAAAEFVGGALIPSVLAVHSKDRLRFFDFNNGNMTGESPQLGRVLGFGSGWKLVEFEDQIEFSGQTSTSHFARGGYTYFAQPFGDRIVFIERQGSLRVVDARDGKLLFENKAEEGSEFRKASISEDGSMTFTQHYFDRPKETLVHRISFDAGSRSESSIKIPVSGTYALIKGGKEIVFATRKIYCCCEGGELRAF